MSWLWGKSKCHPFINEKTLEQRKALSATLCMENPQKYPIIFTPNGLVLKKEKYVMPMEFTIQKMIKCVQISGSQSQSQNVFVLVNDILLRPDQLLEELYKKYCHEDGILYLTIGQETT